MIRIKFLILGWNYSELHSANELELQRKKINSLIHYELLLKAFNLSVEIFPIATFDSDSIYDIHSDSKNQFISSLDLLTSACFTTSHCILLFSITVRTLVSCSPCSFLFCLNHFMYKFHEISRDKIVHMPWLL